MVGLFKNKNFRKWGIGALVVIALVWLGISFSSARANSAAVESEATVVSLNVAETVDASGSLEAQPFASLTWNTSGVVQDVYVKAGDQVKAGDILMKLNPGSVSSNVNSAQADLANAQKDLDTLLSSSSTDLAQAVIDLKDAKQAYDEAASYLKYLQTSQKVPQTYTKIFIEETRGQWKYRYKTRDFKAPAPADWIADAEDDLALKKAQLEDAQRTYDSLKDGANVQDVTATQAKIDAAQATVDSMSIIAPFDGQVLYVESQPEDVVTTESTALNMADLDHPYIEAQIGEADIASLKVGNPVTATLDAVPDVKLTGQVAAINALGKEDAGLVEYTVRIDVDKVAENVSLPLGSTANVTIQVKEAARSLAVPITVIQNESKGEYVLVVQADGSTKRVDVVSGMIVGNLVIVTGDLQEGNTLTAAQNNSLPGGGIFGGRN
ncbi:MAG: HlyD family efflux transporter periplasmic adaptor subunit [Chloroflexi bacterium]|nr:MAG: HlyD family efflux transporter periplasmic adaptor subunit [Chloroflexota bacterium]